MRATSHVDMSSAETFRIRLAGLGLSPAEFAAITHTSCATVRKWGVSTFPAWPSLLLDAWEAAFPTWAGLLLAEDAHDLPEAPRPRPAPGCRSRPLLASAKMTTSG